MIASELEARKKLFRDGGSAPYVSVWWAADGKTVFVLRYGGECVATVWCYTLGIPPGEQPYNELPAAVLYPLPPIV